MSSTTAIIAKHRANKADRIARQCISEGLTAGQAAHLPDAERRAVETRAGTRAGSDQTWRSVVEMLAGSTMPGALCLTCGIGDPEGVPGPPKPFGHEGRCAQ